MNKELKLAIVGLGYVGLPLALEFSKKKYVMGFDINKKRVEELNNGFDKNLEFSKKDLKSSKKLKFTSNKKDIKLANCFIICVPTPVDKIKKPDLRALFKASKIVGSTIKRGDLVIFESTVYPGCTEEECIPLIEKFSNLKFNKDFFCGYSPERINPGDKKHNLKNIIKITSGGTKSSAQYIDNLYKKICNGV